MAREQYIGLVDAAAKRYNVDPRLARAQVAQESAWDPGATSSVGAGGLMQIMPETARDFGYGVPALPEAQRYDPEQNVDRGVQYYARLREAFGDDATALVAYNWGPGNAQKWLKAGGDVNALPQETYDYVNTIMRNAAGERVGGGAGADTVQGGAAADSLLSTAGAAVAAGAAGTAQDPAIATVQPAAPTDDPFAAFPDAPADGPANAEADPWAAFPDAEQAAAPVTIDPAGARGTVPAGDAPSQGDPNGGRSWLMRQILPGGIPFIDSPEDQAAFAEMRARDSAGAAASVLQGATLGFGDDIADLVQQSSPTAVLADMAGVDTGPTAGEGIRAARDQYSRDNPLSALALSVVGGSAPAAGLNAGLRTAGAALPGAVGAPARALTAVSTGAGIGPKLANALRIGGQGALLGGADAAGNGNDVLTGAAIGGVGGAVLAPAAEAVVKGARMLLSSPAASSIRALASRLGESPTELSRRWVQFQNLTGRPPSIVELNDRELAQELRVLGTTRKAADKVLTDAEEAASRARPNNVAGAITGENAIAPLARNVGAGGPVTNVGDAVVEQRALMDRAMGDIAERPVPVTADEFNDFMNDRTIQRLVQRDPELARAMRRADEEFNPPREAGDGSDVADGGFGAPEGVEVSDAFTVRDLEGLRQLLRAEQESATSNGLGNVAAQHGRAADRLETMVSNEVPEFGQAMADYGTRARRITGLKQGGQGRTAEDATTVDLRRDLTSPEGRGGVAEGLRGRLRDEARSSERGALTAVTRLSEDADLQRVLRGAMGPDEATRLADVARVERDAATALQEAARGVAPTDRQSLLNAAAQIGEGFALAGTQATNWFKFRTTVRILKSLAVSSDKAERIVRLAVTPGRSEQTLRALEAEGLNEQQIRAFFNALGASSSVGVAEQTQRRRPE